MVSEAITFLDALVEALEHASDYNANDQVPPAAVLWPDRQRQWVPLVPVLRRRLALLTLGDYAPQDRTGPAYYLRCMIARTLPGDVLPVEAVPIIYLPGVSRQYVREIRECPKPLQPLVELQYRGTIFSHRNGRDWTIGGFLQSAHGGLGIEVGADDATKEALQRALLKLAYEPIARLRKEAPLRAPFFDGLLTPDEVRRLLKWMDDPESYPSQITREEWDAFCAVCVSKYGLHPERDGAITAASRLGTLEGPWKTVWDRYVEAPVAYPNLPDLLSKAQPKQLSLFEWSPVWPGSNASAEARLRESLLGLKGALPSEARDAISTLEAEHGQRRTWVWSQLGRAPLAGALEHLHELANTTQKSLGGASVATIADAYCEWGWKADSAVIEALAAVEKTEDVVGVKVAVVSLYKSWLEGAAKAFQGAVAPNPVGTYQAKVLPQPETGACVIFSDALRFDIGQRLVAMLQERGLACESRWRLAALPPVTPTAKPLVSPVAAQISGKGKRDLVPLVTAKDSNVTAQALRNLLASADYQVLKSEELGDPAGRAWTEFGAIDTYGHKHGWKVAHHVPGELRGLAGRVVALLDHGWKQVVIVTDHGWLLLPNGLPKVELPQHLTHIRRGRCAVLKDGVLTDQQTVPWHWDPEVRIAVPSGICCYEAGKEYEHGGLSPQECVVPIISVTQPIRAEAQLVVVKSVTWRRLRCDVEISGAAPEMKVDIRTRAGDPTTTVAVTPKPIEPDGAASLLVEDEDLEGEDAMLVVLSVDGTVQAQMPTTLGG